MDNGKWWTFKEGNKAGQKTTQEEREVLFMKMLDWAIDDENEALSLQEVFIHFKLPKSTFEWWCRNDTTIFNMKETMKDIIAARVNKGALKGTFIASPSIFRLKQLGEIDTSALNMNHTGSMITEHKVIFQDYTEDDE